MEYSPETLLLRSRKQLLPVTWPQSGKSHHYKSHYFVDINAATQNETTSPAHPHPRALRIYPASPYDISAFIRELGCIRHRTIHLNDVSLKIPADSVPPYTQEIIYLVNHGYFIRNGPPIPPIRIVPHKNQAVPGYSLAWLSEDIEERTVLKRRFPSLCHESSPSGVTGLCSIFYLPAGSMSTVKKDSTVTTTTREDRSNGFLSGVYQSCREYNVRYCLITDGSSSKVVELFQDTYMASSPYDIVLLSDNDDRPIALTLGGLLWEVLSIVYVPDDLEDTDAFLHVDNKELMTN